MKWATGKGVVCDGCGGVDVQVLVLVEVASIPASYHFPTDLFYENPNNISGVALQVSPP